MKDNKFKLDFPLTRTHCGIVMGNGNFGAMIWGVSQLHVTINRSDFWDHRGGELIVPGTTYKKLVNVTQSDGSRESLEKAILRNSFPSNVFKPQRLPVGRFEFGFPKNVSPVCGTLDYATGTVHIELSDGRALQIDVSLEKNLLLIRDPDETIVSIHSKPAWDFPASYEWLKKYGFDAPKRIDAANLNGWIQSCPDDPSLASLCGSITGGYAISLELGADDIAALDAAKKSIAAIAPSSILESNVKWWSDYWKNAVEIDIPDTFYNRFFKYALYKFAAATHPKGYPCSLQGPWQEEYKKAEWSGDYHFNVNVQQIYSLAFPLGKLDHLLPLFDMIDSAPFRSALKHNAKVMFGIEDALWFTHATDDRGQQCGWLIPGSVLDPACGAWTALLYWNYYKYSGDTEFLKNRAMPFLKGIMRGYEAMLEEYEGRLSIPLAISAEYGCSNLNLGNSSAGRDPSYQLSAMHKLADCLIEASSILGITPKPIWLDIKKRLPQMTIVDGIQPIGPREKRIGIWDGQDLDVCHRHHSHLAAIYPFDSLPETLNTDEQEIVDNTLDQWILKGFGQWSEWCIPWAAIICARSGFNEAPEILFHIWRKIFVNESLATVYLPRSRGIIAQRRQDLKKPKDTNEFIQLDGTMGAATAFIEMLVLMKGTTVKLFQGIPEQWRDVSFKNVHLQGGFCISASRKNGNLKSLHILSTRGGTIKIELGEQIQVFTFCPGEEKDIL